MNKTLIVFRHELLVTLRRKSFILVTLAVPLLMLAGYGIYQGVQRWHHPPEAETRIGCVDLAGGFDRYDGPGADFVPCPGVAEATASLLAGEISEFFVIPPDYLQTGLIVRYTTRREMQAPPESVAGITDFLITNLIGDQASAEVLERVRAPAILSSIRLDDTGHATEGQDMFLHFFLPYIFAMLLVFSIFFASGYLLQGVSEEKESRLIEVLLSSVSARQLLAGKVLGLGAAGLAQMLLWMASLWVLIDVGLSRIPSLSDASLPPGLIALALAYYVLGYLLFGVVMAVLGSLGTTARESQSWSSIVSLAAVVPLFFLTLIIENPGHPIAVVLTLIPPTAPITAVMRLSAEGVPAWQLALSLALLAAAIVFGVWAGAKIFRASLLMYGKRPGPREIARFIREA